MNQMRKARAGAAIGLTLVGAAFARPAAAAKIACVGDSITFGYGLGSPTTQSYPAVLQELLGNAQHSVQNFGVSGATLLVAGDLSYWAQPNFEASSQFAPDLVVIMLGTNDSKVQNWVHKDEFADDYAALIDHYRELGATVFVAVPPPVYAPGNFGITPEVMNDEVVPVIRQVAQDTQAPLIDVFAALSGKPDAFPDTIHPNAQGAQWIAEAVLAALEANDFGAGPAPGDSQAPPTASVSGTTEPSAEPSASADPSVSSSVAVSATAGVPTSSVGGLPSVPIGSTNPTEVVPVSSVGASSSSAATGDTPPVGTQSVSLPAATNSTTSSPEASSPAGSSAAASGTAASGAAASGSLAPSEVAEDNATGWCAVGQAPARGRFPGLLIAALGLIGTLSIRRRRACYPR